MKSITMKCGVLYVFFDWDSYGKYFQENDMERIILII